MPSSGARPRKGIEDGGLALDQHGRGGRLGVRLPVRSTRALALAEKGARFRERAREAVEALGAAKAAAPGARAVEATLCAACPVPRGWAQVVPRLGARLEAHPGLPPDLVV